MAYDESAVAFFQVLKVTPKGFRYVEVNYRRERIGDKEHWFKPKSCAIPIVKAIVVDGPGEADSCSESESDEGDPC